jgi:hypothetical protein
VTDVPAVKSRRLLRVLVSEPLGYDPVEAERAARFALECAAEEAGRPAPASVRFEHFVPAGAAAA